MYRVFLKYALTGGVILSCFKSFAQEKGQVIDKIVAVIGNNIVTKSALDAQYMQLSQQDNVSEDDRCQVLEELLYQKLLLAQAVKDSIEVTEAQVDGELDRRLRYYITQFGSEEKFTEFYGKSIDAFKAELRDDVKDLLLTQNMQSKITGDISVTPSEVRNFFNGLDKDSIPFINAEVEIAQIVKKPPVSAEAKKEAKDKIEGLRQRILKGEDFATLAILYSEDPGSGKNGGEYKNIQRGQFVPEFDAVSFSIKEKEISEVFETSYGYHFLQLLAKRGEFVDIRHILITPKVSALDMQRAKVTLDSVYTLISNDSISFGEAAGRFSDDEESRNNNGLIVNPQTGTTRFEMDELGQFDPTIVFTIDKMKTGEVSKPMPTATRDGKQAYRIVSLKNRTEPHVANLKDDYQRIQAMALAKKQQKHIREWIRKKLVGTYVRIDEEYKNCTFQNDWPGVDKKQ